MLISLAILVGSYILIFSELLHRTSAAILGAVVMVWIGMLGGFYSQESAIQAIDGNTIFLLAAMMMVVAMLRSTGAFEYLAIRMTKLARGDARLLLLYLCLGVSLISMVLDNVTTVIVFAPLTVLTCRLLERNPMPFLMAEAMLSNIGGAATLVGDPPNIMIGSAAGIDFTRFLTHMGPPIVLVWIGAVGLLMLLFRRELAKGGKQGVVELDERQAIKDPSALIRVLISLAVIVILFFVHHHLHLYPAYVAFIGLSLALLLLRPQPDGLFGEVNWSVLVFFCGLFVIVGGVEASGLLEYLGRRLAPIASDPGKLLMASLFLMWMAAILSAIVDNIPFTVTMIPIILSLESQGVNITPFWWALSIGVGLGGNGSHIGATANLIVVAESEKCGILEARISPMQWLRVGLPVTLIGLLLATLVFVLFFDFFTAS
ncbi:ArsB/NhaD family transporter [Candidatus Vondammii sp. HM_W22]|uniref:SLC13 family permease n=1 Tax=Candidatus Vondammii sp. HM_W22 TaxID=2687299 RepID=UPI001F139332|nr:ArsB/NhaD family transporter [Candidatus Vondammii sp. HM_W22]